MTADERVHAVGTLGFTERQARFLATVLLHSGVCLPRQYCGFAGIVHGEKTRRFFAKLVRRRFARAYPCRHNRGRVYHVHHRPLYAAVGEPESRLRRPMSAARVIENLTVLDAVLATRTVGWLATSKEANRELAVVIGACADASPSPASDPVVGFNRSARDSLRMAIDPSGRPVFLYVATDLPTDGFHRVLQRLLSIADRLPGWTLRIAMARSGASLCLPFRERIDHELTSLNPTVLNELKWYFARRRAKELNQVPIENEESYAYDEDSFGAPRYQALYRRWFKEGDAALRVVSSTAASDAIKSGAGRVEYHVLPFSYRHLSPIVDRPVRIQDGAEEGEEEGSASRPPKRGSIADLTTAADADLYAGA
jgi:hypothetical protein